MKDRLTQVIKDMSRLGGSREPNAFEVQNAAVRQQAGEALNKASVRFEQIKDTNKDLMGRLKALK